jgi:uncharacterized protein YPO0396
MLESLTQMLAAEYEQTARLRSKIIELTEKLALAHQHAETLQGHLHKTQALLNECRDELPDGMTSRERAEHEAWCDMREDCQ